MSKSRSQPLFRVERFRRRLLTFHSDAIVQSWRSSNGTEAFNCFSAQSQQLPDSPLPPLMTPLKGPAKVRWAISGATDMLASDGLDWIGFTN